MVKYKNLKESPVKLEFKISENTENSEISQEKNTDTNQSPEITEITELPKSKRRKTLKRKGANKEETDLTYQRSKNESEKRYRVCIQSSELQRRQGIRIRER